MITKEVNEWLKKIECTNYSKEDILYELEYFSKFLTREELFFIKKKLSDFIT